MADASRDTKTVLVVDDDPDLLEAFAFALSVAGYDVLKAENGDQAISATERCGRRVDVVLTDVVMPGMSGVELVRILSSAQPGLRSLFMSGYPDHVLREHGLDDASDRFLYKPFTLDSLESKLQQCLRESAADGAGAPPSTPERPA